MQWTKTFCTNICSCMMDGFFSTGYFELSRGVRQGDPLSPFLFVIALEVLLNHLRNDGNIKGLLISNKEIKISAFADDLTVFLDTIQFAENLFGLLANKDRIDFPLDIRWVKCVKILGIFFSHNLNEMIETNFYCNIESMKA